MIREDAGFSVGRVMTISDSVEDSPIGSDGTVTNGCAGIYIVIDEIPSCRCSEVLALVVNSCTGRVVGGKGWTSIGCGLTRPILNLGSIVGFVCFGGCSGFMSCRCIVAERT
jgi:hypothetical protein